MKHRLRWPAKAGRFGSKARWLSTKGSKIGTSAIVTFDPDGEFGDVTRRVAGEGFDDVVAGFTVSDDRAAGTKADVLSDAVDVNVVADIGLDIEIVGALGPLDLHLGAALDPPITNA
jgi:hypothetical protein